MTHAVNLLREHVPQETRMHYVITRGGSAANIVPDLAELSLIARHPDQRALEGIWERVLNCAQAGALASGARMEFEITSSYANYLPNDTLIQLLDRNLKLAGGVQYTAGEAEFVNRIRATLGAEPPPIEEAFRIHPPKADLLSASTDVGDVSWTLPTGHFLAAAFPPGVPLHTWQSTAVAGTSVGQKGMMVAARTLALSALDLLQDPNLVVQAKASFEKRRAGRAYRSLMPEGRKPTPR
jgi:aminobenzoyl-glutamate utilization protein B